MRLDRDDVDQAPPGRDYDQELEFARDGLHRAYENLARVRAENRRRVQAAKELVAEYKRRIAQADPRVRPKPPIA